MAVDAPRPPLTVRTRPHAAPTAHGHLGAIYHIMSRGNRRQEIFVDGETLIEEAS